jgi:ATP-binding cassette, subfamily B, bacterial
LGVSSGRTRERGGVLFLYAELWKLARGRRHLFAASCALLIGAQVALLGIPYVAGRAINALQLHGAHGLASAGVWLGMALAITAASWLLHGPGRVLERNVSLYVRRQLSAGLVERLLTLPLAWHESHHSGATAHRVQQASHALSSFAQSQFIYLNSIVRLIGPVAALWYLEPLVGFSAVLGFALVCVSVIGFDRAMIRLAREENSAERRYQAALVDVLGNTTTLFALRQARGVIALIERRLLKVFEPLRRSIVLNEVKWCTVDISTRALSCVLVALFAWRAAQAGEGGASTLMLGSIYMVWEYAVQSGGVIAAIAQHFQTFARQHADYTSADVVRDAAPGHLANPSAPGPRGRWHRLEIQDLTFRHASTRDEAPALDRVTFGLERGKRYALIGGSGSGKSTLLRVLAGLYACERITLACDGDPVIVSPVESARVLRGCATLVPQDAELFEGTLAENLTLCESVNGPPSPRAFAPALELARASDFVDATNIGLEALVAERAANWSGGQRSRIALARGILAAEGSALVLLDEPTAHLDPATEARVYSNLFRTFSDACLVSAVHRLNLLGEFDEVLLMRTGRVLAQGSPAALMAGCPEFREMMAAYRRASADEAAPQGEAAA